MSKITISFKPKEVSKKLLAGLSERTRDVLTSRYGLGKGSLRQTLESIGSQYNITRERVRQIENFGLVGIKKSPAYQGAESAFAELKKLMDDFGGVVHEQEFLSSLVNDESTQNHLHFMLVVSDAFTKIKEDDEFHHRWTTNPNLAEKVHNSIKNLCQNFADNDLISEAELVSNFLKELKGVTDDPRVDEFAKRWIGISKNLGRNPLGEWGLVKSPNVRMRGIRDFAYLVLRKNGSPMHFTEVAKAIAKSFGKKAHPATCHNELIKDKRFVLVGRGLYALTEWGYSKGTVLEVLKAILEKEGPLTREQVIAKVLKERHVKENTIIVNLQNPKYFKKDKNGKYSIA